MERVKDRRVTGQICKCCFECILNLSDYLLLNHMFSLFSCSDHVILLCDHVILSCDHVIFSRVCSTTSVTRRSLEVCECIIMYIYNNYVKLRGVPNSREVCMILD